MLQSGRTRPEVLEAHYGSAVPVKPLQALQRDSLMTSGDLIRDDVYEIPMLEVPYSSLNPNLQCRFEHIVVPVQAVYDADNHSVSKAGPLGGEAPGDVQTYVRAAALSREMPQTHRHRTGQ